MPSAKGEPAEFVEERGHEGVLPVRSWDLQGRGDQPDDVSGYVRWGSDAGTVGQTRRWDVSEGRVSGGDAQGGENHGV
ncbi:hypothetical protein TPA0905_01340 [Streptomyces olivaceus]|nr:hypothetical protein TPA0905_01340 [Streptomyces olivaceus]